MGQSPTFAPGSSFELINGFLPAQQRELWELTFKIREKLLGLATLRPETAEIKFAWWEQELALLGNGKPRHPLLLELMGFGLKLDLCATWLNEHLIDAKAAHLGQIQSSVDELRLHAFRSYGPVLFISYVQIHGNITTDCAASISQLCLNHILSDRGERALLATTSPGELQFLAQTTDEPNGKAALADILDLATSGQAPSKLMTGVRSIDMLAALTQLRLKRLRHGHKAGRLALLFKAWSSARQHAKHTMENDE